jgi:hypothetical protein
MHGQPGRGFAEKEQIALESTDGLIVASVFLPVHLHRSAEGEWSADWDYESLLSMQTHLRVTRIGVVKWRGWHGNVGKDGSPEGGVPVDERHKVEACLRTLNCVPVWVEPVLLGEMYVHYELYFQPLFSVLQKSHTPSAVHEFVGTMDFVKEYCGQFFTT